MFNKINTLLEELQRIKSPEPVTLSFHINQCGLAVRITWYDEDEIRQYTTTLLKADLAALDETNEHVILNLLRGVVINS